MSAGEAETRSRTELAYQKLLSILEKVPTLKWNKEIYRTWGDYSSDMLKLIDKAFAGETASLAVAEAGIREGEALIRMVPLHWKRQLSEIHKVMPASTDRESEVRSLLDRIQPTGWRKYRDLIVATIGAVIGGTVVLLIQFALHR